MARTIKHGDPLDEPIRPHKLTREARFGVPRKERLVGVDVDRVKYEFKNTENQ